MSRAIDLISGDPNPIGEKPEGLRKFLLALDYTMAFGPDRSPKSGIGNQKTTWGSFYNEGAKLEESLEKGFFSNLYVDREQRQEIKGYIPGRRPLIIHGQPGAGKTVVLSKIHDELKNGTDPLFIYFDIKAHIRWAGTSDNSDFSAHFAQRVYDHIKQTVINSDQTIIKKWTYYKIKNDEGYAAFREVIYDLALHPLEGEEDLEEVLALKDVHDRLVNMEVVPSLTTLLSFLQSIYPNVALCIDNVDRLPLYDQRQVYEICIDLSNSAEICVVLAIRDSNLRRITDSGGLGDTMYTERIKPLKSSNVGFSGFEDFGSAKDTSTLSDSGLSELLQRRIDFLANHGAFFWLNEVWKKVLSQDFPDTKEQIKGFQSAFKRISNTFVDNDMYRFCNHNIRSLLILYSNFIYEMLLRLEPDFPLESILPDSSKVDITRLRSHYYKWLIFRDSPIKEVQTEDSSLLQMGFGNEFNIAYKLLAYLNNLGGEAVRLGIRFTRVTQALSDFGISPDETFRMAIRLSRNQQFDSTPIWFDYHTGSSPKDNARVFLLPSGTYFLETLANSREYAFWSILLTDFPTNDFNSLFSNHELKHAQTLDDGYKLDLIARYISDFLLPSTASEMRNIATNLQVPSTWKGTNIEYYLSLFAIRGSLYVTRLLHSVKGSIPYANIKRNEQQKYDELYGNLIEAVRKLESEADLS